MNCHVLGVVDGLSWAASLYALWAGSQMVLADIGSVLVLTGIFKFVLLLSLFEMD
jgi:hypothetical protein